MQGPDSYAVAPPARAGGAGGAGGATAIAITADRQEQEAPSSPTTRFEAGTASPEVRHAAAQAVADEAAHTAWAEASRARAEEGALRAAYRHRCSPPAA